MIKLLLGGSPCTFWSIAQQNGRETEPEGLGWELFKNYLVAKEKFKPDFFLYENKEIAFPDMISCCNFFNHSKSWLGNYVRKHGNPCRYGKYTICVSERE